MTKLREPSGRMKALIFQLLRRSQEIGPTLDAASVTQLGHALTPLYEAITELEQRAEKWKRVAVAKQTVEMLRLAHKPIRAAEFQEVRDAIADLGDEWTEAIR